MKAPWDHFPFSETLPGQMLCAPAAVPTWFLPFLWSLPNSTGPEAPLNLLINNVPSLFGPDVSLFAAMLFAL